MEMAHHAPVNHIIIIIVIISIIISSSSSSSISIFIIFIIMIMIMIMIMIIIVIVFYYYYHHIFFINTSILIVMAYKSKQIAIDLLAGVFCFSISDLVKWYPRELFISNFVLCMYMYLHMYV